MALLSQGFSDGMTTSKQLTKNKQAVHDCLLQSVDKVAKTTRLIDSYVLVYIKLTDLLNSYIFRKKEKKNAVFCYDDGVFVFLPT